MPVDKAPLDISVATVGCLNGGAVSLVIKGGDPTQLNVFETDDQIPTRRNLLHNEPVKLVPTRHSLHHLVSFLDTAKTENIFAVEVRHFVSISKHFPRGDIFTLATPLDGQKRPLGRAG